MARTHEYQAQLTWQGSTAVGYRAYSRAHQVTTPPAGNELAVTADPTFGGEASLQNPEQLLLAAASSCQLLSFLAVTARAGLDVTGYTDTASAEMPVVRGPMRIARIVLRPRIVLAAGSNADLVPKLVADAHDECFIANTLNAEMVIEPTVVVGE